MYHDNFCLSPFDSKSLAYASAQQKSNNKCPYFMINVLPKQFYFSVSHSNR